MNVLMQRAPSLKNLLYVDDDAFLCNNRNDLEKLTQELHTHFLEVGLKRHVASDNENSKTAVMYFPPTLEDAVWYTKQNRLLPNIIINEGTNFVHLVKKSNT